MRLLSALFCPATTALAVCLGKTFWASKLTAWIRLWHTGRSTTSCAHGTACMRARTQYVAQTIVPSKSHRYDVPEVEFKRKTPILVTLGDFCLSGLRRVFAGFCKFQVVFDTSPRCHSGPQDFQSYWPSNGVSLQNRGLTLLQTTNQSLENCFFLFDSRALIATLRHIASTTRTALSCAPHSHLACGDRNDRTPPNPSAAVAVLRSPATSRSRFQFECRKITPLKLIRFRFICEKTSLGERKQKKKRKERKNAGWFFAGGGRSQPSNYAVFTTGGLLGSSIISDPEVTRSNPAMFGSLL